MIPRTPRQVQALIDQGFIKNHGMYFNEIGGSFRDLGPCG
jgi:hypothetical protein